MNGIVYIDSVEDLIKLDELENVKEIIIRKVTIEEDIVDKINNSEVKTVRFNDCYVKDLESLNDLDVKELDLNGCKIENNLFLCRLSNLETLILDNTGEVDIRDVSVMKNLKSLSLFNDIIKSEDKLFYLGQVEMLRIDGCNLNDLSVLLSLENLKYLVVDEDQVEKNQDVMRKLMMRGVKVVDYKNQLMVI